VGRRALLVALVAAVPVADAAGSHGLAFWCLVAAVPLAAMCALASFGAFLDDRDDVVGSLQALLWTPALLLVLAAAVVRGPSVEAGHVPQFGVSAVLGCLAVLSLKAAVFGCAELYRGSGSASSISLASRVEGSGFRAPVAAKPIRS
jgi:hypothetical protein